MASAGYQLEPEGKAPAVRDKQRYRLTLEYQGHSVVGTVFPARGKWQYRIPGGRANSDVYGTPSDAADAAATEFAEGIARTGARGSGEVPKGPLIVTKKHGVGVEYRMPNTDAALSHLSTAEREHMRARLHVAFLAIVDRDGHRGSAHVSRQPSGRWTYSIGTDRPANEFGSANQATDAAVKEWLQLTKQQRREPNQRPWKLVDETEAIEWVLPPDIAAEYLRRQIAGGMTFGSLLIQPLDLEAGITRTWLPPNTPEDVAHNLYPGWRRTLEQRGILERPPPIGPNFWVFETLGDEAVEIIMRALNLPGAYLIVPAYGIEPSSVWESEAHFLHGQEVYYFVPGPTDDWDEVSDAMNRQIGMKELWSVGTSLPVFHPPIEDGSSLSLETLQLLAERTQLVHSEVYDSESLLVWEPEPNS